MSMSEQLPPVEVPQESISEEAFVGLIENFIFREGTDYGIVEVQHQTKIGQVRRQIDRGDVKIVFDPNTESVTLMTESDFLKLKDRAGGIATDPVNETSSLQER